MKTMVYFLFFLSVLSLSACRQGTVDACTPQCDGKECGPNGCSGECPPGCDDNETCNAVGQCVPTSADTTPPSPVTDLDASGFTRSSITLGWTAPGDDAAAGTASEYDIRYSTASITDADWASATQASDEPAPQVGGASQSHIVSGLSADTTYYFTIKATDDAGNVSDLSNVASGKTSAVDDTSHTIAGVQIFPADSVFNTPVDTLEVHAKSAEWIGSQSWDVTIDGTRYTGPGILFNSWSATAGYPYNVVNNSTTTLRDISFRYGYQSDYCPGVTWSDYLADPTAYHLSVVQYRIPDDYAIEPEADAHVYIINTDTKMLYEIFTLNPILPDGTYTAQSGAIYDLTSNKLRGSFPGTTNIEMDGNSYPLPRAGAGAAGVPNLPLFVTYEEIEAGEINHALYVAIPWTRGDYIWPARAYAESSAGGVHTVADVTYECPPMGARVRLKESFDISDYPEQARVILAAMKKYGAIVADNAFKPYENELWREDKRVWWIWGVPDENWTSDVNRIQSVKSTDLEFVDESSLMINPNSGQAIQP